MVAGQGMSHDALPLLDRTVQVGRLRAPPVDLIPAHEDHQVPGVV